MLNWLSSFLDAFPIIPRLELIAKTHGGVKFGRGGRVKELGPGLHWYWPMMSDIEVYPTARTTMDLPVQTLEIEENGCVIVSAILVYRVRNVLKALTENYDIEDTISDVARAAVARAVRAGRVNEDLKEVVHKELSRNYGVDVLSCVLTDYAPCRVIRNVCDVPDGVETDA